MYVLTAYIINCKQAHNYLLYATGRDCGWICARDGVFSLGVTIFHPSPGGILHPFTWTVGKNKEPLPAVLFSWFIVQVHVIIIVATIKATEATPSVKYSAIIITDSL